MLITNHWSVSPPEQLNDYHVEFALKANLPQTYINDCYTLLINPSSSKLQAFNWTDLASKFNIWKNDDFMTVTTYGTYLLNHDPRDHSSNIEVAAMCMDGAEVQVEGPWGVHPYTAAHALMHCAINARIGHLKSIDLNETFDPSVDPGVLQNGPIYVLSTHGERALQTNDQGADTVPALGYFAYSGDSDCRWDLAALDPRDAHLLANSDGAVSSCHKSANRIRLVSHLLKELPMTDMFGLDK